MIFSLEYYPEPWDINKPPPAPPNRSNNFWGKESVESKQRRDEWIYRLEEYGKNLENKIEDHPPAQELELISEKEPVILNRYELMEIE